MSILKSRSALLIGLVALVAGAIWGYFVYTSVSPTQKAIVGKWLLVEKDTPHGLEFRDDGTFRIATYRRLPRQPSPGTFTIPRVGHINMTHTDGTVERARISVIADELTLHGDGGDKTVWKRVEAFPDEIDHPNGRASYKQEAWIVGAWQGTMKSTMADTAPHRFDFYADGTYAHLATDRGFLGKAGVTVKMGTYRFHPGTDNFLDLTFEDSGETETRYAVVSADKLALCDGREGTTVHDLTRVTADRPEMKTADDSNIRTAFGLYRAFKQDRVKAEASLKDRPVIVHGVVGSSTMSTTFSDVYLYTGARQCVRCVFADPAGTARTLQRGVRWGNSYRVIVRGTFEGLFKETGRGKAFELFTGLKIDESRDPPVLRFGKCQLLGAAVLLPLAIGPVGKEA